MSNPLDELLALTEQQKSISTAKLRGYLEHIQRIDRDKDKRINGQQNQLEKLNKRYQEQRTAAEKRKRVAEDYENLKHKHNRLKAEHTRLREKYERG